MRLTSCPGFDSQQLLRLCFPSVRLIIRRYLWFHYYFDSVFVCSSIVWFSLDGDGMSVEMVRERVLGSTLRDIIADIINVGNGMYIVTLLNICIYCIYIIQSTVFMYVYVIVQIWT